MGQTALKTGRLFEDRQCGRPPIVNDIYQELIGLLRPSNDYMMGRQAVIRIVLLHISFPTIVQGHNLLKYLERSTIHYCLVPSA